MQVMKFPGVLAFLAAAGCASSLPGLPRVVAGGGDVRFMQAMIAHHAQALDMAVLAPDRAATDAVRRLALRIHASQMDEIARMRRWLRSRGVETPDVDAMHATHEPGMLMPGMLTAEQMAALAASSGVTFDRLFLDGMIRHHEGALAMVADLFATAGAGQDVEVFQLASQIDADQRVEIARMHRLLDPAG